MHALLLGELVALLRERARGAERGRKTVLDGGAANAIALADFTPGTHL